ncbi:MAG TPA: pinensin family lanthipeptide [Longimicrobium sp.]|nr:pinensin family lanthipeptide [Longimicrobium sp.]
MRKVKLDLEQLAVESFETSGSHGRGTVLGRMPEIDIRPFGGGGQYDTYPNCPSPLCQDTPLASCDGSCQPGCVPNETVAVTG